ncbi:MAG: dihydropteroate synthase [Kiritimatiellae bacterium]|nr:dihydropteroate synthase [Kiritimatiellia bacterium]
MTWTCRSFKLDLARPLVMGIVNVTPDSFSDGGLYYRPGEAVARARNCVNEGADIVDLGGESTRPGATPLSWQLEWSRLEPVLHILQRELPATPVSVDTYHPETAARALGMGAAILNCVYPEASPAMVELAAQTGCGLVLPCRTEADFAAISARLPGSVRASGRAVDPSQLLIDPEIGFGTTREEDLALLGSLRRLAALAPVCVGVSRKRLVKKLTGEKTTGKNLGGCLGAAVWCALAGASVLRVHDVRETRQAIDVARALDEVHPMGGLA